MPRIAVTPVAWFYDDSVPPYGVIRAIFEPTMPDDDPDPASYIATEQHHMVMVLLESPVVVPLDVVRQYTPGAEPSDD